MRLLSRPLPEKTEPKQHGINVVDLMMWLVIAALLLAAAIQSIGYYQKAAYLYQMNAEVEMVAGKVTAAAAIDGTSITDDLINRIVGEENAARPNDSIVIKAGSISAYAAPAPEDNYGFERAAVVTATSSSVANYIKVVNTSVPDRESVYFFKSTPSFPAGVNVVNTGALESLGSVPITSPTTAAPTASATSTPTPTPSATVTPVPTPTPTPTPTPVPTYTSVVWTAKPNALTTNIYRAKASADLSRIIANGSGSTSNYLSKDGGTSWKATGSSSYQSHGSGTSRDGMKMVTGCFNDNACYLSTSIDGGESWVTRTGAGMGKWEDFTISEDGTKIVASDNGSYGGIWVSTDSGATWLKKTASGLGATSLSGTSDGRVIWATSNSGIRISSDYGSTWVAKTGVFSSGSAASVSVSPDNKYIAVGVSGTTGGIYFSSDSGATWNFNSLGTSTKSIPGVAVSDDGKRLAATDYTGNALWTSIDSGATWQKASVPSTLSWRSVLVSADGMKFIATAMSGQVYTGALG